MVTVSASVPVLVGLVVVSTAVVWKGSAMLETAAEQLSRYYGLPPIVHGAIVVAIGSSFPELSSTVLATLVHDEFDLGVGAIVGSAIFNVLVIPAAAALSTDRMAANRDVVYKEAQFYMLSVAVLLLTFSFGVIYYPTGDRLHATITRPLAVIPVLLYGLYVFIQYQDVKDHEPPEAPDVSPLRAWGLLALSLGVIVVSVEGLVQAAIGLGDAFGTPSFLWGLTVIAASTSLPDTFVSVRAAQADRPVTSLANVLGSNIFDLLVALPVGVLLAGATVVNYGAAVPMMGALTFATIVLFAMMRTDLELTDLEAVGLLVVYTGFLAWMGLETAGLTSFVPGL